MQYDLSKAAQSDDVADALDYAAVSEVIIELVEHSDFQLIEAVAEAVMKILFEQFAMHSITLELRKPTAVRKASAVGIKLHRERQDFLG